MRIIFIIFLFFSFNANSQFYLLNQTTGGVTYDTDAQDYITRVEAHGVTLTTGQKNAINTYVVGAKADGDWAAMNDAGLLVHANANANAEKIKGGVDVVWYGTITHGASGAQGNGSTGYGDLGVFADALTNNNTHLAIYSQTNSDALVNEIGARAASTTIFNMYLRTSDLFVSDHYTANTGSGRILIANTNSTGYFIASRTSSTDIRGYRNGSQIGSTNTATSTGALPNRTIYLLAYNLAGTAANISSRVVSYYQFGAGMAPALAALNSARVNTLLTAWGLNTY